MEPSGSGARPCGAEKEQAYGHFIVISRPNFNKSGPTAQ
jgi:hypothetical protein